jgi:uncharacterized membrane protein HdeD (DUF308 family)
MSSETTAVEKSGRPWWLLLLEGIVAIIVGILLFTSTEKTVVVLVQFIGLYWLIRGIFDIVSIFIDHTAWGWKLFTGIIGIIAGVLILQNTLWAAFFVPTIMVWILGLYGIIGGIVMLIQAFQGGGWGVGIMGVILILLGIFILANTLLSTAVAIWLSGFVLVIGGIVAIVQAFRQR